MSTSIPTQHQRDELKYHMLRGQLDKIKYLQSFDYSSMELIEEMLNEILSLRRQIKNGETDITELKQKNETLILGIAAYKHQNTELFKQNSELHNEVISLLEKQNFQGKDLELKRLNEDTNSLKFLLSNAKEKNQKLQKEIAQMKQRYIELVVNIYEKKINMQKIFTELQESDQINLKDRGIETFGQSNNNNNENSNRVSSSGNEVNNSSTNFKQQIGKVSSSGITNYGGGNGLGRGRGTNKEMIEKIYNLECELKDKNKEIAMLKKNIHNENILEQKVIIDYLKNELRLTKEKYDCYIKYQIDKNDKMNKTFNNKLNKTKKIKQFNTNDKYEDPRMLRKIRNMERDFTKQLNEIAAVNSNLELENRKLNEQIQKQEKSIEDYKDKVSELNKMIYQVTSYNDIEYRPKGIIMESNNDEF
jgi:hypothetical protein